MEKTLKVTEPKVGAVAVLQRSRAPELTPAPNYCSSPVVLEFKVVLEFRLAVVWGVHRIVSCRDCQTEQELLARHFCTPWVPLSK